MTPSRVRNVFEMSWRIGLVLSLIGGFTGSDRRRRLNSSVMATHWTLGCDAADPAAIAEFWAYALGYVPEPGYDDPGGASIIDPDGVGPAIGFLRVPEGKSAKNRMHIDIRVGRADAIR